MNQKIVGVIPLIVALLFVAAFAVGDNQAVAANPENQVVTVTVPEAISIAVQTPISFGTVSAGTSNALTPNYWIENRGNVKIDLYAKANAAAFTSATATDTIAISGNYFIKDHDDNFIQFLTTSQKIYDDMNKASQGSGTPETWNTAQQRLTIPAYTEDGAYSIGVTYTAVKHNTVAPA